MRLSEGLYASALAGDERALAQMLAEIRPDLRRYARRLCRRSVALDDVVQEALIVVYRRMGTVRDPAALAGWLVRVVARICMLPALMLISGVEDLSTLDTRARFASLPTHDLRLDLARALESLPPGHRAVVILRDFEEMTIAEIAERLAMTPEAVKSRLHRARVMLREYLTGDRSAT